MIIVLPDHFGLYDQDYGSSPPRPWPLVQIAVATAAAVLVILAFLVLLSSPISTVGDEVGAQERSGLSAPALPNCKVPAS